MIAQSPSGGLAADGSGVSGTSSIGTGSPAQARTLSFEMQNHEGVNAHGTPRREITGGQCRYREYNGCE
jgi:hypothetical protein